MRPSDAAIVEAVDRVVLADESSPVVAVLGGGLGSLGALMKIAAIADLAMAIVPEEHVRRTRALAAAPSLPANAKAVVCKVCGRSGGTLKRVSPKSATTSTYAHVKC